VINHITQYFKKGGASMELKMSVSEAAELIKEVKSLPSKIFEYIDTGIKEAVGSFLTNLMD